MKPDKPDDHLAALIALEAAICDLHDLLATIHDVGDTETRTAVLTWMSSSRLRDIWGGHGRTMH